MESCLENNEVRLPRNDSFETNNISPIKSPTSCQYFKSSFARSLSFNTNQSQSLDFELSFRISKSPPEEMPATPKPFTIIPKRKYISNNRLQQVNETWIFFWDFVLLIGKKSLSRFGLLTLYETTYVVSKIV